MGNSYIKFSSYEEIQNIIKQGYTPIGDLKRVLEEAHGLLVYITPKIYVCERRKIIDIAGAYIRKPYPWITYSVGAPCQTFRF